MSRRQIGYLIRSATRTLALLEYFRERQTPASVQEIADALSMPQSSTSVLLKTLVSLNYIDYDPSARRFLPSYRVTLMGDWIQRTRFGSKRITDILDLLRTDTGENVMLGQQIGAGMQYLHILPATYRLQISIQVGEIRPMSRCALGQVLLSRKSNAEICAIVRRNNADEDTASLRLNEVSFIEEIDRVRRCGFSESRGRMTIGVNTIGMISPSPDTGAPLAIGVGGPAERIASKRAQIIDAMRRRLGFVESADLDRSSKGRRGTTDSR
jgi:DNA-binding IclR family transcriptional regulator